MDWDNSGKLGIILDIRLCLEWFAFEMIFRLRIDLRLIRSLVG